MYQTTQLSITWVTCSNPSQRRTIPYHQARRTLLVALLQVLPSLFLAFKEELFALAFRQCVATIQLYEGHESLWHWRRYLAHHLSAIPSIDTPPPGNQVIRNYLDESIPKLDEFVQSAFATEAGTKLGQFIGDYSQQEDIQLAMLSMHSTDQYLADRYLRWIRVRSGKYTKSSNSLSDILARASLGISDEVC